MNGIGRRLRTTLLAGLILSLVSLPLGAAILDGVFVQNNNFGIGNDTPPFPLTISRPGQVTFQFHSTTIGPNTKWNFKIDALGRFAVTLQGGLAGAELQLFPQGDPVGTLRIRGPVQATAFNISSSRSFKENFTSLDPEEVLARVVELPVSRWNFKSDESATPHIGPVAEDFHAAFGVGADERYLSVNDVGGVALAAIQGLHAQVREKDRQIEELLRRLESLERRLDGR